MSFRWRKKGRDWHGSAPHLLYHDATLCARIESSDGASGTWHWTIEEASGMPPMDTRTEPCRSVNDAKFDCLQFVLKHYRGAPAEELSTA